jgi:hypothetical protein
VGVHGHVIPVTRVSLKVPGEPVRKILGHVVDGFTPVATRERRTHLAGATGVDSRDALVQS